MKRLPFLMASALVLGLVVVGCGQDAKSTDASGATAGSSSTTAAPAAGAESSGTSAPSSSTTAKVATTAPTPDPSAPTASAGSRAFVSPTGNISCEINPDPTPGSTFADGSAVTPYVSCQTTDPPRRAILTDDYKVTRCSGADCVGDPGSGTPVLPYGKRVSVGPFRCTSEKGGVTCVENRADGPGSGFKIAKSGITDVADDPTTGTPAAGAPCTKAALSAALPAGEVFDDSAPFGCSGDFAYAYPTSGDPGGGGADVNTITQLFKASGNSWAAVERVKYCSDRVVPADIWPAACDSN